MSLELEAKLFGIIKRAGRWYVAHCPPLDLTTQGRTIEEAKKNLREAAELFLISCMERGTLELALRELGLSIAHGSEPMPQKAFGFEVPIPLTKSAPECHV